MSKSAIQNVVAVQNEQQQGIIGFLTWYSVRDQLIQRDELKNKLLNAGFGEEWLPNGIRPSDAFRRATKEIETKRKSEMAGLFENYLVREVFSDHKMVQRNIVCEVVDQKGKRLTYDGQAAILTLDKKNNQMEIVANAGFSKTLAEEAQKLFELYRDHYSDQHIRFLIANMLKSMAPTPVRPSGGVYMIPVRYAETLERFCRFVNSLEAEAFKIPLVNTYDNRQMMVKKLSDHFSEIIRSCNACLQGQLKKGQVKEIINEAKRVISDFKDYRDVITNDIDFLEEQIHVIRQKVSLMIDAI